MTDKADATVNASIGRREVFKIAGVGAVAGLGLTACAKAPEVHFTHGVASGDPTQTALVIWTRVVAAGSHEMLTGTWETASDEAFAHILRTGAFATSADRDFTVKVDATDLPVGATVFYRFRVGAVVSAIGRGRTLPTGNVAHMKLALFSCSNYAFGYFNAYRHCAARDDIDIALHVGDYLYEYGPKKYGDAALEDGARVLIPAHEIVSLDDYRARYALYRADADLQEIHRRQTFITVWDDHESANDSWMNGAQNHHEDQGDWSVRRANAVRAYFEWMPIRPLTADSAQRSYRSFAFGDLASLIMLDTRLYGRDKQLTYEHDVPVADAQYDWAKFRTVLNDPNRSILGAEQEAWLTTELQRSAARGVRWRLLGQQTLMGLVSPPDFSTVLQVGATPTDEERKALGLYAEVAREQLPLLLDSLGGSYRAARARILNSVLATGGNTLVLSGDSHNAWTFALKDANGKIAAVEIGGTSVTSPGLESDVPMDVDLAEKAFVAKNPELAYCRFAARGYAVITLTPDDAVTEFIFLDTVKSRTFIASAAKQFKIARTTDGTTSAPAVI